MLNVTTLLPGQHTTSAPTIFKPKVVQPSGPVEKVELSYLNLFVLSSTYHRSLTSYWFLNQENNREDVWFRGVHICLLFLFAVMMC